MGCSERIRLVLAMHYARTGKAGAADQERAHGEGLRAIRLPTPRPTQKRAVPGAGRSPPCSTLLVAPFAKHAPRRFDSLARYSLQAVGFAFSQEVARHQNSSFFRDVNHQARPNPPIRLAAYRPAMRIV